MSLSPTSVARPSLISVPRRSTSVSSSPTGRMPLTREPRPTECASASARVAGNQPAGTFPPRRIVVPFASQRRGQLPLRPGLDAADHLARRPSRATTSRRGGRRRPDARARPSRRACAGRRGRPRHPATAGSARSVPSTSSASIVDETPPDEVSRRRVTSRASAGDAPRTSTRSTAKTGVASRRRRRRRRPRVRRSSRATSGRTGRSARDQGEHRPHLAETGRRRLPQQRADAIRAHFVPRPCGWIRRDGASYLVRRSGSAIADPDREDP